VKPREIKAELIRKDIPLTDIANEAESSLSEVSRCISGKGLYMNIRNIIALRLNKEVHEVFNKYHPKPKRKTQWCQVA
jgi:hypothetical protein